MVQKQQLKEKPAAQTWVLGFVGGAGGGEGSKASTKRQQQQHSNTKFAKANERGGGRGGGSEELWCRVQKESISWGRVRGRGGGSIRKSQARIRAETVSMRKSREHKGRNPQYETKNMPVINNSSRWILGSWW